MPRSSQQAVYLRAVSACRQGALDLSVRAQSDIIISSQGSCLVEFAWIYGSVGGLIARCSGVHICMMLGQGLLTAARRTRRSQMPSSEFRFTIAVNAQSYTVLRQRYLTGGEALLNEWNARFLASRTPGAVRRRGASRSLRGAVRSAPVAGTAAGKGAGASARACCVKGWAGCLRQQQFLPPCVHRQPHSGLSTLHWGSDVKRPDSRTGLAGLLTLSSRVLRRRGQGWEARGWMRTAASAAACSATCTPYPVPHTLYPIPCTQLIALLHSLAQRARGWEARGRRRTAASAAACCAAI